MNRLISLAMLLTLLAAVPAHGGAYIKLGDIKGESTDAGHEDEIDVHSWSWGMSREAVVGGGGAGKAVFKEFTFVKRLDKSSPKLMESCATGTHIPTANLKMSTGSDPLEYLTITLTDVIVSSYTVSGDADDRPTEEVTLNFTKVQVEYIPQKQDGTIEEPVTFGWDIAANAPIDPTGGAGN